MSITLIQTNRRIVNGVIEEHQITLKCASRSARPQWREMLKPLQNKPTSIQEPVNGNIKQVD